MAFRAFGRRGKGSVDTLGKLSVFSRKFLRLTQGGKSFVDIVVVIIDLFSRVTTDTINSRLTTT